MDHGTTKNGPSDNREPEGTARLVFTICGLLLLAVTLVSGQTLRHDFVNYDDPQYVSENPQFANALADCGQVEAAVAHYRRALEIKPDFAEAHNNLGIALEGSG